MRTYFDRLQNLSWWQLTLILTAAAVALTLIPWAPLSTVGAAALLTLLPGMQIVRWLGLRASNVWLSAGLGLVLSPLWLFFTGVSVGLSRWSVLAVCLIVIVGLTFINNRAKPPSDAPRVMPFDWLLGGVMVILAIAITLAYTEGTSELGAYPIVMGDWVKHHGVTWSLRYTGIPPLNVFFAGMAPDGELSYYFFFHLTVASLDILRGGTENVHSAFVVLSMVAAVSFVTMVYHLARHLFDSVAAARWSMLLVSLIGGLDIIPTVRDAMLAQPGASLAQILSFPNDHIDNWTPTQHLRLSTFPVHHLWVPQHIAALLIVTLALYLYRTSPYPRRFLVIFALLLASLPGHSAWIALVVGIALFGMACYHIAATFYQTGLRQAAWCFGGYAAVAVGAAAVFAPFGMLLLETGTSQAGIVFEIPHRMSAWAWLAPWSTWFPGQTWAHLLDVPLHFFVEMGALLLAGVAGGGMLWRSQRGDVVYVFLLLSAVAGFAVITFFASGRTHTDLGLVLNNDLGLRASMPAQLALALFGGYCLAMMRRWLWVIFAPLVLLGMLSAAWEFGAMGITKYYESPIIPYDVVTAYDVISEVVPRFDTVQHSSHTDFARVQPGFAGRFNGYSTSEAIVFHGKPRELALAIELSEQAFANTEPLRSYQLFRNLGADFVFVNNYAQYPDEKFNDAFYFIQHHRSKRFNIYEVRPLFEESTLATFDGGNIEFRGHFIDNTRNLVLAWRLTEATATDYTVFIHLVDSSGDIIAQADHQLWAWDVRAEGPTRLWTPGLTHLDVTPIPAEALSAAGDLSIRLGLWVPAPEQRFPVEDAMLEVDAAGRLIIGTVER